MQQENPSKLSRNGQKNTGISPETGHKSVLRSAVSMASGTMASRVLGLVRDQAFVALFPPMVTDAWTAAFRLPNMFRRLLGEGSLSVSFIPVFVDSRMVNGEPQTTQDSKNFVNSMALVLFLILTVLTVLGILLAPQIMNLMLEESFKSIPGKFDLTVRMAQIMFGFIYLMSFYAFFMGILNALGMFGLPAMAPVFFNIAMIIANFLPHHWFPVEGDSLAWGVLVGGFLQLAVLIPSLKRKGYLPKFRIEKLHPRVFKVLKNMGPGMIGMGLLQITTFVNLKFASSLDEGTISSIYLADRLLELPLSLISVSLGTALLPTLASLWSQSKKDEMIETLQENVLLNLFVALPCAMGLFALSLPIVELLFRHLKFDADDAARTALIVRYYALILLSASTVRIITPMYYAVKNTWFPAVASFICIIFHILCAPFLMKHFGIQGLISSTFLSGFLNLIILGSCIPKFVHHISFLPILKRVALFLVPTGIMGAFAFSHVFVLPYLEFLPHILRNAIIVGVFVPTSTLLFCMVCAWLNIPEYQRTFGRIFKKIFAKFSPG